MQGQIAQMPNLQPLPYRIAYSTGILSSHSYRVGEEKEHTIHELLLPSNLSQGWESAKDGSFPQTLILQFVGVVELRQVQFWSHNAKISTKIELLSATPEKLLPDKDLLQLKYKRLGYLSLSSNESTGFSVRELKSVYLTAKVLYLRINFHKAYSNKSNPFGQIGLMAINCMGNMMETASDPQTDANIVSLYNKTLNQKLQALEIAKLSAAAHDDFDKAKLLKFSLDKIHSVINHIKLLENNKMIAVKREDYDNARMLTGEIYRFRNALIIDPLGMVSTAEPHQKTEVIEEAKVSHINKPKQDNRVVSEFAASSHELDAIATTSELLVPAIKKSSQKKQVEEDKVESGADLKELQKSRKLAERYSLALKPQILDNLFSTSRSSRTAALDTIEQQFKDKTMEKVCMKDEQKAALALLGILSILAIDSDATVSSKSIAILEDALVTYPYDLDAEEGIFFTHIDTVLAALTDALNSNSIKSQEKSIHALTNIAKNENISLTTMFWHVTKSDILRADSTHALVKLRAMQQLIAEHGPKDKTSVGKRVIDFLLNGTRHGDETVESTAWQVLSECKVLVKEKFTDLLKGLSEEERTNVTDKLTSIYNNKVSAIDVLPVNKPKACEFCGKEDEKFVTQDMLDLHMYSECPLLTKCQECNFVIEIANVNHHLLTDCEKSTDYSECQKCHEAILKSEFEGHINCKESNDENSIRCPLCHLDVKPCTNDSWKDHILTKCKRKKRSKA